MAHLIHPVVGDDGELQVEVATKRRKRRLWLWVLVGIGVLLSLIVVTNRPNSTAPLFYRSVLGQVQSGDGIPCGFWNIRGMVEQGQSTMTMRAWTENGETFEGRVHTTTGFDLMIGRSQEPLLLHIALLDNAGNQLSDPFDYRFFDDQSCVVELNFVEVKRDGAAAVEDWSIPP